MIDLDELIAEAREWPRDGINEARTINRLADALVSVRAERDAAVAAVERVRGVLSKWESRQERNREILCSGVLGHFQAIDCTGDLVSALDGVPDPEWAVQYGRRNRETGALHWLTGDPRDDWWHENQDRYEHVKRYTSPPIPAGGESNDASGKRAASPDTRSRS